MSGGPGTVELHVRGGRRSKARAPCARTRRASTPCRWHRRDKQAHDFTLPEAASFGHRLVKPADLDQLGRIPGDAPNQPAKA